MLWFPDAALILIAIYSEIWMSNCSNSEGFAWQSIISDVPCEWLLAIFQAYVLQTAYFSCAFCLFLCTRVRWAPDSCTASVRNQFWGMKSCFKRSVYYCTVVLINNILVALWHFHLCLFIVNSAKLCSQLTAHCLSTLQVVKCKSM